VPSTRYDLGMPPIADRCRSRPRASVNNRSRRPGLLRAHCRAVGNPRIPRVSLTLPLAGRRASQPRPNVGAPLRETYLDPAFARGENCRVPADDPSPTGTRPLAEVTRKSTVESGCRLTWEAKATASPGVAINTAVVREHPDRQPRAHDQFGSRQVCRRGRQKGTKVEEPLAAGVLPHGPIAQAFAGTFDHLPSPDNPRVSTPGLPWRTCSFRCQFAGHLDATQADDLVRRRGERTAARVGRQPCRLDDESVHLPGSAPAETVACQLQSWSAAASAQVRPRGRRRGEKPDCSRPREAGAGSARSYSSGQATRYKVSSPRRRQTPILANRGASILARRRGRGHCLACMLAPEVGRGVSVVAGRIIADRKAAVVMPGSGICQSFVRHRDGRNDSPGGEAPAEAGIHWSTGGSPEARPQSDKGCVATAEYVLGTCGLFWAQPAICANIATNSWTRAPVFITASERVDHRERARSA